MSTSIPTGNDVLRAGLGWVATAIVSLVLIAEAHARRAAEVLSIADFVGHFRGAAQVQADDLFFVQQVRDAEVEIRSDDNGFRLSWTTGIHSGEGGKTPVRRRNTEMRFVAGPTPSQFRSPEPLEPFAERPNAWAYIDRQTPALQLVSSFACG